MELRHLRYFLAVAEELHFTRAAARLHIGQPPLSQQIQALEAELGVTLFERTRRSVALTEAGEHLVRRAREILGATGSVAEELQRIKRGEQGELRIGFTASGLLIPDLRALLRGYHRAYPDVSLKLREMFTHAQFAALVAGELDIGFVRYNGAAPQPGLHLQFLRRDRLCLVLPEEHHLARLSEVPLAACRDEEFIFYPETSGASMVGQLRRLCAEAGFVPRVAQEAREAQTQIGLVATGLGIAVLTAPMAAVQLAGVCFVPLADEGAYLDIALASRAEETSPRVRGFLAALPPVTAPG